MKTRPQIVFTLGVMGLKPYDQSLSGSTWARGTYERLIETAIKRGLDKKTRRQLIGAARRGVATPFAMEKIEAVCSKLEPQEIDSELISLAGFMCIPFSSFFQQGEAT
jgi:hypothetical protein